MKYPTASIDASAMDGIQRPIPPMWPDWPLLPEDAIACLKGVFDQSAWNPGVLNGILPLGESPITGFEVDFAALLGVPYALGLASGAAALHTALMAAGVGPGDEVILSAYSWPQSLVFLDALDAVPVFCDVLPETLCLDPASAEERMTDRTQAVIVEHTAGCPAPAEKIVDAAHRHGALVIEDCAAALGAKRQNRLVGTIGDLACFSLGPKKHLPCGEGGVLVTQDASLFAAAVAVSQHPDRAAARLGYAPAAPGFFWPYRMHPFAGALGSALLPYVTRWHKERARNHDRFRQALQRSSPRWQMVAAETGDEHAWGSCLLHLDVEETTGPQIAAPTGLPLRNGPVNTPLNRRADVQGRWGVQPSCPVAEARCGAGREWILGDTVGWTGDQSSLIEWAASALSRMTPSL